MRHYSAHNPYSRSGIAQLLPSCQFCQTPFQARQVVLLREVEQAQLMHAQCVKCRSSMVLLVLLHELGMGSVGLVTDLSGPDAQRLSAAEPVSTDDVLTLHQLLQDSDFLGTI